ncbi:DUF373 family protein [Candidatus Micrarchaeota archaeon]|nr:DUF373 family protein [Candidatus Micrarchaeota archaeon]
MKRPILILCIDRDNDLYEKGRVNGPLIGRDKNLEGALALSLADPEDPDSNAIYYAVKTYDQMRKEGHNVEVATLTGDKNLGYKADKNVSNQLDRIMVEINPASCVLISDGASDEEVLPIIKSRIKVDSTKIVFIKQAKELEKTYFVLLEKLKDPYFARTLIGIPAVLIILLSLSSYYGLGWQPVGFLIGIALLLRIFAIDEVVISIIKDFRFSFERTSWIGYIGALAIFIIAAFVGNQTFYRALSLNLSSEKTIAWVVGSVIWIFFIGTLMVLAAKGVDAIHDKRKYDATKYLLYGIAGALSALVIFMGSSWVINMSPPYVSFGTFLATIAIAIVLGHTATNLINWYRKEIVIAMKIEGKEALSEQGAYLGKIVGVDAKKGKIVIQNIFDKKYAVPISSVRKVENNVILQAID